MYCIFNANFIYSLFKIKGKDVLLLPFLILLGSFVIVTAIALVFLSYTNFQMQDQAGGRMYEAFYKLFAAIGLTGNKFYQKNDNS